MFLCHLCSFLKQQFLFLFHFQLCLDFFKTWLTHRLEVPISYNFLSKITDITDNACICSTWWLKERYFFSIFGVEISIIVDCFNKRNLSHTFFNLIPTISYGASYNFTFTFQAVDYFLVSALILLGSTKQSSLTSKKSRLAKFFKGDAWS